MVTFIISPNRLTRSRSGPRILEWKKNGWLGPDVLFSHCNVLFDKQALDDESWAALKENGCAIGSTPEDELCMAHGNPVAFEAVDRGVKCGLGIVGINFHTSSAYRGSTLSFPFVGRIVLPSTVVISLLR